MASIKKRPDGKWRARYRDPDGRERASHFETRAAAQSWLDAQTASMVRGDYIDPNAARQTFREYAEQWRAAQVHRPQTEDQIERTLRLHVYPSFGDRPIGSIRPTEIQAWVRGRSDHLGPATLRLAHRWLSTIFRAAVRDDVIRKSPCTGIRLPRQERVEVVPLTVAEVHALADAVPARFRAAVIVAAGAGLRLGEVMGLTVDRVDFLRRTVRVDRQMTREGVLGPPKTEASVRTVPLAQVVVEALAAHLAAFPTDGLLFTWPSGRPIRPQSWKNEWAPAVARAGAPAGTGFHALRHHFASLLIRYGESVTVVQHRLGHASAAETLGTYSHLWPDSDERTREAIDTVLGASADQTRTMTAR
jgi:integrase